MEYPTPSARQGKPKLILVTVVVRLEFSIGSFIQLPSLTKPSNSFKFTHRTNPLPAILCLCTGNLYRVPGPLYRVPGDIRARGLCTNSIPLRISWSDTSFSSTKPSNSLKFLSESQSSCDFSHTTTCVTLGTSCDSSPTCG